MEEAGKERERGEREMRGRQAGGGTRPRDIDDLFARSGKQREDDGIALTLERRGTAGDDIVLGAAARRNRLSSPARFPLPQSLYSSLPPKKPIILG